MGSVEACKDDEAFARSLQALYDADDLEDGDLASAKDFQNYSSDSNDVDFVPEIWQMRNPGGRKNTIRKRRKARKNSADRSPPVLDQKIPEMPEVSPNENPKCEQNGEPMEDSVNTDRTEQNPPTNNVGLYSEKEENLFLEGLELFGRDWCRISGHVGTRNRASITSHAQKHLIQMWIRGDPLPAEVAKGGSGYSLSGKALDPDSSSVKPYIRAYRNKVLRGEINSYPGIEAELEKSKSWSSDTDKVEQASINVDNAHKKQKIGESPTKTLCKSPGQSPLIGADGKTDYSRNRPQRDSMKKIKRKYLENGYELVKCTQFPSGQPFELSVSRIAMAIMDLHAHLLDTEIVGVLGGIYDPKEKKCMIKTAFPCDRKSIETDTTVSVEATEESLAEAVCKAHALGMNIVGWYHSHPIFSTDPSRIDLNTQHEHQVAFHGYIYNQADADKNNAEPGPGIQAVSDSGPFIGAICGPYSKNLRSDMSEFNWFVIADSQRRQPHRLKVEFVGSDDIKNNGVPREEFEKMLDTINLYRYQKYENERCRFDQIWRRETSYKSKLIKSISSWLLGEHCDSEEDNEESQSNSQSESSGTDDANPDSMNIPDDTATNLKIESPQKIEEVHKPLDEDTNPDLISLTNLINKLSVELDTFHVSIDKKESQQKDENGQDKAIEPAESSAL